MPDWIPVAQIVVTTFVENVLQHTDSPAGVRLETDGIHRDGCRRRLQPRTGEHPRMSRSPPAGRPGLGIVNGAVPHVG